MRIEDFTIEKYKSGELFKAVPHFEMLKNVIENDSFHDNDSVYNHTLRVAESIRDIALGNSHYRNYFCRTVKKSVLLDLITAAALFHDTGKLQTYKKRDGVTSCEGHEMVSYSIVSEYLSSTEGDDAEKEIVREIVRQHAVFYPYLDPQNDSIENDFIRLEKELKLYPELLLFCIADIRGSQLKDNDLELYLFKDSFLCRKLSDYTGAAAL